MAETKVFDKFTGIGVASGFKLQAKSPLDGRLVVDTIADRDALVTENGAYEGMKVYVKANKTTYTLKGTMNDKWEADGAGAEADIATLEGRVDTIESELDSQIEFTQAEKDKLAGIATGANKITVDTALSSSSTNPVQNKAVNTALSGKVPTSRKINDKALTADITLSATDVSAIPATSKGAASGVAELDENGKVPSSQLPSFVDDVVEVYVSNGKMYKESAHTTQITGEGGKIYIDLATNKTYRWSGTALAEVSASLALGETSSTAYRGDRGKTAYDHSQAAHAPSNAERNTIVGVQMNGTDITADANRKVNITTATTSAAGLMSENDKSKLDGIATGANKTTVDGELSSTSTNPVQNKVVKAALDGKAATSHGTHVSYGTTAPKANGTAAAGTETSVSRSDHVHPLQTTVSGNAGTATKLAASRTIAISGGVTGTATGFDGSANIAIPVTAVDAMKLTIAGGDILVLDGSI